MAIWRRSQCIVHMTNFTFISNLLYRVNLREVLLLKIGSCHQGIDDEQSMTKRLMQSIPAAHINSKFINSIKDKNKILKMKILFIEYVSGLLSHFLLPFTASSLLFFVQKYIVLNKIDNLINTRQQQRDTTTDCIKHQWMYYLNESSTRSFYVINVKAG